MRRGRLVAARWPESLTLAIFDSTLRSIAWLANCMAADGSLIYMASRVTSRLVILIRWHGL
jgi:hypothetical protein